MTDALSWLHQHKFSAYLTAFLLMLLPSGLLYLAAQRGENGWIAGLLVLIILGNLLAVAVD